MGRRPRIDLAGFHHVVNIDNYYHLLIEINIENLLFKREQNKATELELGTCRTIHVIIEEYK